MNKLTGPKKIPISQIKLTFFVRTQLDEDRVLFFAQLYDDPDSAKKVPPLQINSNSELVDGRHRLEALKLLERTDAMCFIDSATNRTENIIAAIKANMGGSLPPTQADMEQAIEMLMGEGMKMSKIREVFPLPPSVLQKFIKNVHKRIHNRGIGLAIDAIVNRGYTVEKAADFYKIEASVLREKMGGRKKRRVSLTDSLRKGIEFRTRSFSQAVAQAFSRCRKDIADGEMARAEFDAFVADIRKSAVRMVSAIDRAQERIHAMKSITEIEE